jgi:hypothetical protein
MTRITDLNLEKKTRITDLNLEKKTRITDINLEKRHPGLSQLFLSFFQV